MSLFDPVMSSLLTIVTFLFVMTVVVFFHELGHFAVGRLCGVQIDAFSIGFGPELLAYVDRKGTRWRVAAVPLGGYVKFHGDMNAASAGPGDDIAAMPATERATTFQAQSVAKRAAIVAAGPVANFILALVVLTGMFYSEGRPAKDARIGIVNVESAAARAGFEPGDVVDAIDGRAVKDFADMHDIIVASGGTPLRFSVDRGGRQIQLSATPDVHEDAAAVPPARIGVLGVQVAMVSTTVQQSVVDAGQACWAVVSGTAGYIGGVISGHEKADQLAGPIGIASVAGQAARMGFGMVLKLISILSISIGLINLVPVPLLDGGHLLFYAYEVLRGRPMSAGAQEFGFKIGLALVSMLMLFATYNDIAHHLHG